MGKSLFSFGRKTNPGIINRCYHFPSKIKLDQQFLKAHDREIPLPSGMSVIVNIKVPENRAVMSLITELVRKQSRESQTGPLIKHVDGKYSTFFYLIRRVFILM